MTCASSRGAQGIAVECPAQERRLRRQESCKSSNNVSATRRQIGKVAVPFRHNERSAVIARGTRNRPWRKRLKRISKLRLRSGLFHQRMYLTSIGSRRRSSGAAWGTRARTTILPASFPRVHLHLHLFSFSDLHLFDNSLAPIHPSCLAITQISSCAASSPASRSAAFATSATANAPCATPTCAQRPSCESATSVPSATTRTSVSSAVVKVSVMLSTASNARVLRRTETAVLKLSIWEVRGRTYFTKRKVSGINDHLCVTSVAGLVSSCIWRRGDLAQACRPYKCPV